MATRTMLKYVQLILSSMDSDEVETYDESVESLQVADILEQTFYEIINRRDWEYLRHRVRRLDSVASSNNVTLAIPKDVSLVESLSYYDYDKGIQRSLEYVSPTEFISRQESISGANVEQSFNSYGVVFNTYNDRCPDYWTSFDESTVMFNAYDSVNQPMGVTPGNSVIMATIEPVWIMDDAYIPDMPSRMESLLLHEAMSACWLYIKQEANPKAEAIARRQFARMKTHERKVKVDNEEVVDYGRKPRGYTGIYCRR